MKTIDNGPFLVDQMDARMLGALIETLPVEISIINANDEVVGWNRHQNRLFKRSPTSMGLNFRECHPKESLDKVERIVSEMKQGQRDRARFWIDLTVKGDSARHKILIEFYALRDHDGTYLGCMECVQDIEDLRRLEGQKRILDDC